MNVYESIRQQERKIKVKYVEDIAALQEMEAIMNRELDSTVSEARVAQLFQYLISPERKRAELFSKLNIKIS